MLSPVQAVVRSRSAWFPSVRNSFRHHHHPERGLDVRKYKWQNIYGQGMAAPGLPLTSCLTLPTWWMIRLLRGLPFVNQCRLTNQHEVPDRQGGGTEKSWQRWSGPRWRSWLEGVKEHTRGGPRWILDTEGHPRDVKQSPVQKCTSPTSCADCVHPGGGYYSNRL
ncbi:uncharacterized protein LOC143657651 [Tamandua tetradactyla]|uniref:uncharacterized protein LOC143657651 n=1 Tax=Tamandua tetradactyla TaxID=48850 RepID=UPI0040539B3B